ncbi:MAG: DNA gyrase subunit A [Pseudomonadota bacterium]
MTLALIHPIKIEQEIKTSFLNYSMSVIVSRALPDVRDGLKPVHRRILFAMHDLKNYHNKPYLKSARIVGDVIGKYHPHGDSAVYDALVRMAQPFSLRYPLVDGQGNFGSVDGDSAAAMRYTESRMHEISEFLLADLDRGTVDFVPNYDNKEEEPTVLPSMVPQLIINGASGIAVGMATNIPPHNLGEIIDGLEAIIAKPETTIDELMLLIHGPDFPTAAEIHGVSGIRDAYLTGRGSVVMRSKAVIEQTNNRDHIIFTEIPFQANKARIIEKIAELVQEKKIEGISDIRDESAKEEIRIVVDIKRGESAEIVLNHLFKLTPLQTSFGVNMVALVKGLPRLLNLKQVLEEFYHHRREVVVRRTAFLLGKAEERAHILQGLKLAVENVDEVVKIIRASSDSRIAGEQLIARFDFSDVQAKAILDLRLARLTGLEREKIVAEYNAVMVEIADYKDILDKPLRVTAIILDELKLVREKFADKRRTVILASAADQFTMESLVADLPVAVTVSHTGYVKRTPLTEIQAQKRGGKGKAGMLTKDEDFVESIFHTTNHQNILCFTNLGRVYNLKVYEVPEAPMRARGKHFANLVPLQPNERVVQVLPISEFKAGLSLAFVTREGYIKKTELMSYSNVRSSGIIALTLEENDALMGVRIVKEDDDILIATSMGKAIRFPSSDVRDMGRSARGVTGIRFSEADRVIGLDVLSKDPGTFILSVSENGYGKRTELEEYRTQSRGGKGIYTIKVTEKNGPVVGIAQVKETDHIMMVTTAGTLIRSKVSEIGVVGRNTQGVILMRVSEGEKVNALSMIPPEELFAEGDAASSSEAAGDPEDE